ncbi:prenyltransferase/squalene oxidase repeat-containing protein [Kitasatospora sp. NPDC093679]|uniref:prenyltransferase/squalene oxidase repeat-containing protein n=1 Tax=Kitasatospora sp. NPDC093679 TaxID=3154983 RepID=UPI0034419F5D
MTDASAAAGWAGRQLKEGSRVEGDWGPDFGLTADVVLALSAAGQGKGEAKAATDWLAANATSYLTGDTPGDIYAGSAAKLALVAEVQQRDPKSFGGHDLLAELAARLQPSGRYTDHATFGGPDVSDFSNTFSQAFALLALDRQGADAVPAKAIEFLTGNQCVDGGFPVAYPDKPADCASDADGTGIVVQALLAVGRSGEAAKALDWLEKRQAADGGFGGSGPTASSNSNSTALAVQALRAGGRTTAADKGVSWLKSRQVGCAGKSSDRGAIGYQKAEVDGTTLRATVQAVPALAGVSLAAVDGRFGTAGLPALECTSPSPSASGSPSGSPSGSASASSSSSASASASASASVSGSPTGSGSPSAAVSAVASDSAGPGGTDTGGTPSSGGLASTGFELMPPVVAAIALLLLGAAAVLTARRLRSGSHR